jgi:hypothetical protein
MATMVVMVPMEVAKAVLQGGVDLDLHSVANGFSFLPLCLHKISYV